VQGVFPIGLCSVKEGRGLVKRVLIFELPHVVRIEDVMIAPDELSVGTPWVVTDHERPFCSSRESFFMSKFFRGLVDRGLEAAAVIGRSGVEVPKVLAKRSHFTRGQGSAVGSIESVIIQLVLVHETAFEFPACF
jgi:hypothetical protein